MTILVTGGAGFIGSNFVLDWLRSSDEPVVNLDKLTYAGNLQNLATLQGDARHVFVQGDFGDAALVAGLLSQHQPRAVINFAAESHVDRSIHGPGEFIQTNIVGTFHFLEAVRLLGRAARGSQGGVSLFACIHRRSVWLASKDGRCVYRDAPL
jgi:dTDP-glucose 4,6-dehydratase